MKLLSITENDAQQRLDKFLKKLLKNSSMSYIYKLIRKGNIKVNGKKKKNDYLLLLNDELKIYIHDDEYDSLTQSKKTQTRKTLKTHITKKDIIHEDTHLLVINKKPWVIVHPWDFKTQELSLIEQVHDYVWEEKWGHTFKPSLVHRIDKETSWIILIAKQKQLLTQLVSDFKNQKNISKTYTAFCLGPVSRNSWTIKKKLLRITDAKNENKVQISEKWQAAISHFRLKNSYSLKTTKETLQIHEFSITIETGRMHQIRVHMASLWNPIVGDTKYWDKKLNSFLKNNFWVERQFLHASKMSIYNSLEKKQMHFTAPLPKDMRSFISNLLRQQK